LSGDEFEFVIDDKTYQVSFIEKLKNSIVLDIEGVRGKFEVVINGNLYFVHNESVGSISMEKKNRFPVKEKEKSKGGFVSPMPSQVVKLLVKEGQKVKAGDGLIVLSSMKMENTVEASADGEVKELYANEGDNVEAGFLLMKIEENK